MPLDVLGFDHIDLTVDDLTRSRPYYEKVFGELGFRFVEEGASGGGIFANGMKLELVHYPWGYWKLAMTDGRDERARYPRGRPAG